MAGSLQRRGVKIWEVVVAPIKNKTFTGLDKLFYFDRWRYVLLGFMLLVLSLGTVFYTIQQNSRLNSLVECAAQIITINNSSFRVRDEAQVDLNNAMVRAINARQEMFHVLTDTVTGRSSLNIVDETLSRYDAVVEDYRNSVVRYADVVGRTSFPSSSC